MNWVRWCQVFHKICQCLPLPLSDFRKTYISHVIITKNLNLYIACCNKQKLTKIWLSQYLVNLCGYRRRSTLSKFNKLYISSCSAHWDISAQGYDSRFWKWVHLTFLRIKLRPRASADKDMLVLSKFRGISHKQSGCITSAESRRSVLPLCTPTEVPQRATSYVVPYL